MESVECVQGTRLHSDRDENNNTVIVTFERLISVMRVLLEFKAGRMQLQDRQLVPDSRMGRLKLVEVRPSLSYK